MRVAPFPPLTPPLLLNVGPFEALSSTSGNSLTPELPSTVVVVRVITPPCQCVSVANASLHKTLTRGNANPYVPSRVSHSCIPAHHNHKPVPAAHLHIIHLDSKNAVIHIHP